MRWRCDEAEYYTQDRDVMLTWATCMAAYGKDNALDLQNEANIIRAEYNNYMTESGIGKLTGLDHKNSSQTTLRN